jgi:hypothetical protein
MKGPKLTKREEDVTGMKARIEAMKGRSEHVSADAGHGDAHGLRIAFL